MTGHNGPTRGAIGIIDRAKGINAQESIENITPDVPIPKINEGCGNFEGTKQYSFPYPLDGSRFLVCARGPVLVRTYSGQCQAIVLPSPENGMQYFCAQPIRPRHRPPTIGSAIVDANPAAPEERVATLVLQDVYNGLEPWVRRGEVKTAPRGPRDAQDGADRSRAAGLRLPVPRDFLRGDLRRQDRAR